jgi:flagella basal body P-ring formation protein FlgA
MSKRTHLLIAAIVCTAITSGAQAAVEISLRPTAQLDKSVVRLGDVADIVADDSRRAQQLADLILMPAPAPGTERFLSKRELQDLLAAYGEDLNQVRFSGNERVRLEAAAPKLPSEDSSNVDINHEARRRSAMSQTSAKQNASLLPSTKQIQKLNGEIERAIREHVSARSGQSAAWRIAFDIDERYLPQFQGAMSPLVCKGGSAPWTGQQRFIISFATAKGDANVPVYADVAQPEPIVTANRAIERGETITAADLELQFVSDAPVVSGQRVAVKTVDELVGLEAARTIQPGEVIYSDQVQAPLLVKRGDAITVTAQGGGIRVRTTARARQDGARGELIEVEALETKERYDVRVVGAGEAAVFSTAGAQLARRPSSTTSASRR